MDLSQVVLSADPQEFWFALMALIIAAAGGFYFGFRNLRRLRMMEDTPTAKIRSAPQGYGEFEGHTRMLPGEPIRSPLTQRECVWYSYKVEERHTSHHRGKSHTQWRTIDSSTSEALFLIVDDTGEAIIDPDHAEVSASSSQTWYGNQRFPGADSGGFWTRWIGMGNYRYSEKRIHEHDPLYVLGLFTSVTEAEQASFHEDVSALLRSWKADPAQLQHHFDQNKDGHIDTEEWDEARRAAKRQVTRERSSAKANEHTHVIRQPIHGHQPFVLSCVSQADMIQRCRLKAAGLMGLFFVAGALSVYMINVRLI